MLNIGRYNKLKVTRLVDFGAYLDCGDDREVLMPAKFADRPLAPGDEVEVFVYTDSRDRLIATTERPYATVGECAYLQVAEVNRVGAFLDLGLEAKQLLVPFAEQKTAMRQGGIYLVYVYLDNNTGRMAASQKVEKYIGNVLPRYERGDAVQALVVEHTDRGYRCIVDNLHWGMIYHSETFSPVEVESTVTAYVKAVREDGKLDLSIRPGGGERTGSVADRIMQALAAAPGGVLPVTEKSSPAEIEALFSCSKRDFKQAVGHLYKRRKVTIADGTISLARPHGPRHRKDDK